jgi:hypothetical protein
MLNSSLVSLRPLQTLKDGERRFEMQRSPHPVRCYFCLTLVHLAFCCSVDSAVLGFSCLLTVPCLRGCLGAFYLLLALPDALGRRCLLATTILLTRLFDCCLLALGATATLILPEQAAAAGRALRDAVHCGAGVHSAGEILAILACVLLD